MKYEINSEKVLRVAHSRKTSVNGLDPAKVILTNEVLILRILYGRLLSFDENGRLITDLASTYELMGNDSVKFLLNDKVQTRSGIPITTDDVAFSIRRLLLLGSNSHGDLKMFLCPEFKVPQDQDAKIEFLKSGCANIEVNGPEITFKVSKTHYLKFFIKLLGSIDYSIIPRSSVDWSLPELPIIDYKESSGTYFLDKDDLDGNYIFIKNITHPYSNTMNADTIQFVSNKFKSAIKLFTDGEVDLLITSDGESPKLKKDLVQQIKGTDLHESLPINTYLLKFTRNALNKFTSSERLYLGQIIKKVYLESLNNHGVSPTLEHFPPLGEGSLSDMQRLELEKLNSIQVEFKKREKVWWAVSQVFLEKYKKAFSQYPFIELYVPSQYPWMLPINEQPDCFIMDVDASFFEDISLISYHIKMDMIGMTEKEGQEWLAQYMAIEDKAERIKMLSDLHFNFLKKATLVPIGRLPYFAIARAPWKIHFPKFFAGSPLWLVTFGK